MAKVFQIWSTVAGYDELFACDFSQSETEKYFEWIINCNNNIILLLILQSNLLQVDL